MPTDARSFAPSPSPVRQRMEESRHQAEHDAAAAKDSMLVVERIQQLYATFDPTERRLAGEVLMDWALSEDATRRYDAVALIDAFCIDEAIPALQVLSASLAAVRGPEALHERLKVERVLAGLRRSSSDA